MDFISGEKIQQLCDVYCGNEFHLNRNPIIKLQTDKHCNLDTLYTEYDNPLLVFCYSQCLDILQEKLHLFKNNFILVSHNEDTNITEKYIPLANSSKIIKWFAQNLMIVHPKVHFLPIGIANSMWPHGNMNYIESMVSINKAIPKTNDLFFNFRIHTNTAARQVCVTSLTAKGLQFVPEIPYHLYLQELSKSKFIVCPDGNGIDCHRIWEGYAVGTIPILLKSTFSLHLQSILPCIILDNWSDLNMEQCITRYDELLKSLELRITFCKFTTYKNMIMNAVDNEKNKIDRMNNVFCFIGELPSYAYDTVYQLRLFDKGPIYFIVSDPYNPLVLRIKNQFDVIIVPYIDVEYPRFTSLVNKIYSKFCIVQGLKGREKLFIYSFERFFLLSNLIKIFNLNHVFFIEVDNLIYANPNEWVKSFSKKEMAFLFDNNDRYASGICYCKGTRVLDLFLELSMVYLVHSQDFLSEMTALYYMRLKYPNDVHILPILWPTNEYPSDVHSTFGDYDNTLFDAAGMGIYLGGMDPFHTNGVLQLGLKSEWSLVNYTRYTYEWKMDERGRKIPYIWSGTKWLRINNLHIHSKDLKRCISIEYDTQLQTI